MNNQLKKTTVWVLESLSLEDLKGRLEYCFEFEPSFQPFLVPTFGGKIPNEDGVHPQHKVTTTGLEFVGNNYLFGYTGNCQFGVVSWDEERLLVFDEEEHNFHIVVRSEFNWFGGSNNTFNIQVVK